MNVFEFVFALTQVYRRGLQAIPLSVDLWLHYITFLRENQDTSDGEAENRIRAWVKAQKYLAFSQNTTLLHALQACAFRLQSMNTVHLW